MTLYQFAQLSETDQIKVFNEGELVGKRSKGDDNIECRQIDDFYVEYHLVDGRYIDMRSFRNPDLLAPYLEEINIDLLFV